MVDENNKMTAEKEADKEWSNEDDSMLSENQNEQNSKKDSSTKGILAQCLVTGAVMLTSAACGMPIGYSATLLPQLESTNGTMHIDEEMGSWIASMHSAATPLGSFLSGVFMERYGRKAALQIAMIPLIAGWIIISSTPSYVILLVGRIIAGSAVGLAAAPGQVLIGEIAQPVVRGIFSSVPFASYAFGILLVYAFGSVLHWRIVAALSIALPFLGLIVLYFLPESPVWLLRKDRIVEGTKALAWLRGGYSAQVKRETDDIISRAQSNTGGSSSWRTIFTHPQALKPFIILNVYNWLQILSGTYIIVFYAVDIIKKFDTNNSGVDSFLTAVLTSGVRFLFTIIASILLAIVGRRPLALASAFGTAITCIALGSYLRYGTDVGGSTYVPTTLILLYVAVNTVGFMILPGVMLGELYPTKVRGIAGGLTFMTFHVFIFATAKIFPMVKHLCGIDGMFWLFGLFSIVSCVFLYLLLPETKGRTLSHIEDYFLEKNILWITRDKEWERKNILKDNQPV